LHIAIVMNWAFAGKSVLLCTNLGNGPTGTPACPLASANLNGVIVASSIVGHTGQGAANSEACWSLTALALRYKALVGVCVEELP